MHSAISVTCALLLTYSPALAATFKLHKEYSGKNFFTGWDFADGVDSSTHGAVNYLDQSAAASAGLATVNSDGHAIIKVDDTTNLPNVTVVTDQLKRNSISISTHDWFPAGSVFVLDANHVPFGCSVWPAFWTRGPNWPNGGEIDIVEYVNHMASNQMVVHTLPGCTQPKDVKQLGTTEGTDCSAGSSSVGCKVVESQANSLGQGFAKAGGGVWATQFDTTGIFVWFWSRKDVPSDLKSGTASVNPSKWGTPSAAWPSGSSCNISHFFTPQQLVIDITLCGDFAGQPNIYQSTGCSKPGVNVDANTCYIENVNGTGANYADAFFDINYVKVFSFDSTTSAAPGGSTTLTVVPSSVSRNSTITTTHNASSSITSSIASSIGSLPSNVSSSGSNVETIPTTTSTRIESINTALATSSSTSSVPSTSSAPSTSSHGNATTNNSNGASGVDSTNGNGAPPVTVISATVFGAGAVVAFVWALM